MPQPTQQNHRFRYWIRRMAMAHKVHSLQLLRKSSSRVFIFYFIWNTLILLFPVINTACSHLDLSECLAWFVCLPSTSWRLLGFVVTFDIEYKVKLTFTASAVEVGELWLEWMQLVLVVKGSNSAVRALLAVFHQLLLMFFLWVLTKRQFPPSVVFHLLLHCCIDPGARITPM